MGYYTEYLDKRFNFEQLAQERKVQLKKISDLRNNNDILVYASDLNKNAPILIDYTDILPFQDQLSNLHGKEIDIIIETPGGYAEVVEDIVRLLRGKYEKFNVIIPGYAKSAGTIFAMAADDILMGTTSALGPIDAQIMSNNKKFSADAFIEGLEKIKKEVLKTGKLNPAYIPILQNISPGEIQHCENAQNFSQKLVYEWLAKYKFKNWKIHRSTTGKPVLETDKIKRAKEIAKELCKHSRWLTHGRSIKIKELESLKLIINDYSKQSELNEAITRYYTLLRMTFETNIYKVFETCGSQIYRFFIQPIAQKAGGPKSNIVVIDYECPNCKTKFKVQANIEKTAPLHQGFIPYPVDDNEFKCNNCGTKSDLSPIRVKIEAQFGKKIVK